MARSSQNIDVPFVHEEEEQEQFHTQESNVSTARQVKTRGSDIFTKHFHIMVTDGGEKKDVCNYCGKIYKHSGGYGSLTTHMRKHHPTEMGIDTSQQQIGRYASGPEHGSSSSSAKLFKYTEASYKEELAKFVSMEHLAFSFGEKMTFNNFMHKAVNPATCRVPRNTCKRKIMELFLNGKKNLKDYFKSHRGRVSICSDIWSDHWQSHSYMGITCHWIDDAWMIQKRIIAFRVFDDSHTAHNIYLMISNILKEYSLLHNKVLTIGFDNAAANTASINDLKLICQPNIGGKFFHVRCVCHILNLCVQDGLKTLTTHITPIKQALNLIWTHNKIRKEWVIFCKQNGVRPKKFSRDVPTRWNSTYFLLNDSFAYKDLLCTFVSQLQTQVHLYPSNWDVCSKILNILKVFNDTTNNLSGVYYPTSNMFMLEALNIVGALSECAENETDVFLLECCSIMRTKWLNYFTEIPLLYMVSTVFDPRFKLDGLENALQTYYSFLDINPIDIGLSATIYDVRNTIDELFTDYVNVYGIQPIGESSRPASQSEQSRLPAGSRWLLQRNKKSKSTSSGHFEIEKYLTTPFEFPPESFAGSQFLILDWWHQHEGLFPVLSVIAKELFAAPVSTVSVEQAFSSGGNILDARRSTLHPSSLEAQACLDDWSRAELRQQEHEPDSFEDLCDHTDTGTGTESSMTTAPPSPEDEEES